MLLERRKPNKTCLHYLSLIWHGFEIRARLKRNTNQSPSKGPNQVRMGSFVGSMSPATKQANGWSRTNLQLNVTWPTACRPTELGGLGIIDLKLARIAVQSRWLWPQRMGANGARAQLSIKAAPKVHAFFKDSTYIRPVMMD